MSAHTCVHVLPEGDNHGKEKAIFVVTFSWHRWMVYHPFGVRKSV